MLVAGIITLAVVSAPQAQSQPAADNGSQSIDTQVSSFLTFFESSQPPTPKPGTATIHVEQNTGQVLIQTPTEVNVLSRAAIFYYSADNVVNNNRGYSPITYHTSNPDGFFSTSEGYARIPLDSAGLMKHFKVAVAENTKNGPVKIEVHVNGGQITNCGKGNAQETCSEHDRTPIGITIPAGAVGIFDFGFVNININQGDQITYELDATGANSGKIRFEAVLAL